MTERPDAIVIGAGHNGLVCAASLARAGLGVTVLEARDVAGGMSSANGAHSEYRFPGLVHTSFPISGALRKHLQLDKHGYVPGDPVDTVSLQTDGRHLTLGRDGVSADGIDADQARVCESFLREFRSYADALSPMMMNRPPRLKNMDFTDKSTLAKLGWKIRLGLGKTSMYEFLRVAAINIHDVLEEALQDERLKGLIAADAVIGHHMGPRTPGTVLTWLLRLHSELNGPLSVESGDSSSLIQALLSSAQASGVTIRLAEPVARILVDRGRASGVELQNGERLDADLVISSADPRRTFLEQVGAPNLDAMFAQRVTQIRGAGNVAKLQVALSGQPEIEGLLAADLKNRFVIAPSMNYLERAFNDSKYGDISADPLIELTFPSAHNPSLAPDGHHVMSVNIGYLPYKLNGGWEKERISLPQQLIEKITGYVPNLSSLVVSHELLTPPDIERDYHAVQGHWHHGEMTIHQSFMMRPLHGAAQYDTPVDGLFLCGAGCHPGGGLTGLPGYNAARRVLELRA